MLSSLHKFVGIMDARVDQCSLASYSIVALHAGADKEETGWPKTIEVDVVAQGGHLWIEVKDTEWFGVGSSRWLGAGRIFKFPDCHTHMVIIISLVNSARF